jgi:hypothetical protein
MTEPLNEPFGVVPRYELADDPVRQGETLKAVEIGTGSNLQPQPKSTPQYEQMWRSKTRAS